MPNRLANEISPYLLQHATNPVDWHPWGPEALAKAKREDKPIFLSVGYSACHWCHVMERESFENESIARLLNEHFVPVKVDREERPDLDRIYMDAVQAISGRGGWPLSVFLTPDQEPFFGGTYWPPQARMGLPGFGAVLAAVADAWENRRREVLGQARLLTERLRTQGLCAAPGLPLSEELFRSAAENLTRGLDPVHGGFRGSPKFPQPVCLQLGFRLWRRQRNERLLDLLGLTLDNMARGGIYDHLAGGFARYCVDAQWRVPHFEKMLYDNALLADAYLDGFLATGRPDYARVAGETLDYILTYLADPAGGYHSSEDADSGGEEGAFYLWTPEETRQILGREAAETFCCVYGVSEAGNFAGKSILHLARTMSENAASTGRSQGELERMLAASRARLLQARDRRVRPGKDDKVLVSWNALTIHALARAAGILEEAKYLAAASRAAEFILARMRLDDGSLLHCWRAGTAKQGAYVDDYALLANALVTLYEASFEERWVEEAVRVADAMLDRFYDPAEGGFYFTAHDHEPLIARVKDLCDDATPSGSGSAAMALVRLGKLTSRAGYVEAAGKTLLFGSGLMQRAPLAGAQLLMALELYVGPTPQIVILGNRDGMETAAALRGLRRRFIPNRVVAFRDPSRAGGGFPHLDALFAGKAAGGRSPSVYVCQDLTCSAPVAGADEAETIWARLAAEGGSA